jgi:Flp pilus assembly pilin Flp
MMQALRSVRELLRGLPSREEGQGMVEYVLIIGTISLIVVAAFLTTGITGAIQSLAADIAAAI